MVLLKAKPISGLVLKTKLLLRFLNVISSCHKLIRILKCIKSNVYADNILKFPVKVTVLFSSELTPWVKEIQKLSSLL